MKLNNKQVCVGRGGRWEVISVVLVARFGTQQPPAYDAVLQKHIDAPPPHAEKVTEDHVHRYAVYRRSLSRKELLGLPIPIEWLK